MGLCYQTSKWLDRLWGEHIHASAKAKELITLGLRKQGADFVGFPADLHARLYLPGDPKPQGGPQWAEQLHSAASELAEWHRLKTMCARNGFAAGIATETLLEELLPHLEQSPAQGQQPRSSAGASSSSPADAALRAALRKAARSARDAVQQAEAELEGVSTSLKIDVGTSPSPADLKAVREAHGKLKDSKRLQRIAELAGRLERTAVAKAKSKIRPGIGEIHGVEHGDDLARLLPSELATLRHPRLRLAMLAKLMEQRALTYGMTGREPMARGPIIVLLDESGSMRESEKDIWSKAVCLAILSTATRQKRDWCLIAFNARVTRTVEIPAGKASPMLIQEALDHRCAGGTDFNLPIKKAVEILNTSKSMKQADVIMITDGESEIGLSTVRIANDLTHSEGVSWVAVGIGEGSKIGILNLKPISTSSIYIKNIDDPDPIIPVINMER